MSFNLFKPLAVSVWLQASVWKMGNLDTFIDSNSNSHTLKFHNIFQLTMHIHTCFRQFLQQFGEIDRIIILSMDQTTPRLGEFLTCSLLQLVRGRLVSLLMSCLFVLPVQGHFSGNRPLVIGGPPMLSNILFPAPMFLSDLILLTILDWSRIGQMTQCRLDFL